MRLILLLSVFSIITTSFSQSTSYIHFPDSGSFWRGDGWAGDNTSSVIEQWQYVYIIGGDTLIDSSNYKKLYYANHIDNSFVIGAIREDTIEQRVYFYNIAHRLNDKGKEYVLYDFSLRAGDPFPKNHYVNNFAQDSVGWIDSMLIGNTYHKMFFSKYGDYYVEGIGFLTDLLDPWQYLGSGEELLCYVRNGKLYYHAHGLDTCDSRVYTSIQSNKKYSPEIKVYPNPFADEINLLSDDFVQEIEIHDSSGKMIYSKTFNLQKEITIQLSSLNSGLYFLRYFDGKKWRTNKIFKTN